MLLDSGLCDDACLTGQIRLVQAGFVFDGSTSTPSRKTGFVPFMGMEDEPASATEQSGSKPVSDAIGGRGSEGPSRYGSLHPAKEKWLHFWSHIQKRHR